MASKQTRKSISITGDAYWALKARCEKDGTSMSGVAERLIREFLDLPGREAVAFKAAQAPKAKPAPRPYSPAKDIETVLGEVVGPPMVVAKGMVPPKPATVVIPESIPADRSEQIKAAVDRIEARKTDTGKQVGVVIADMASKIFTF
jgi:hypothetical protein